MRSFAVYFSVFTLVSTAGCGATCDRNPDREPTRYTGGTTDTSRRFYETSPWEGPYVAFDRGDSFLLVHGLGGRPREIQGFLSFSPHPLPGPDEDRREEHSNVAFAAGNQLIIDEVTDEYIKVRNDTCSDIFIRVTASVPEGTASVSLDGGSDAG